MKVNVINKSNNKLPVCETYGSAGMDLLANTNGPITLKPMQRLVIKTGLHMSIPEGYEAQIRSRSGLAIKHGIVVLNAPGTIDSDYRGDVGVIIINLGDEDYTINHGDRIAQLVFNKYEKVELVQVESLDETERGEQGYGHTGI